jgi:hypothetical protein
VYHYQVAEKMRIGELLLLQEKIDPWVLSHTLKEQASTQQRLVSLLVSRAHLELDEGALILSEQLGYPAALQRHFERRDMDVLDLLPHQFGARWVVLPLARTKAGSIIVVARDPTPILAAALEHAMRSQVVLAVTPSFQVERMVRAAYGLPGADEEPLPSTPPTMQDVGSADVEPETPLPLRRARTVTYAVKAAPPDLLRSGAHGPIDETLHEIDRAITEAAVERLVMAYATKRWHSALLLRLTDDGATGVRGHGTEARPDQFWLPLVPSSMVSMAVDVRRTVTTAPATVAQRKLDAQLGTPTAAAPVIGGGEVVAALVVGPVIDASTGDALAELDRLVDALGAAYDRFRR